MSSFKTLRLVNPSGNYIEIRLSAEGGGDVEVGLNDQGSDNPNPSMLFQFSKTDGELIENFLYSNPVVEREWSRARVE